MAKKYLIVINDTANELQVEKFVAAISANYANIKGGENVIIIKTDDNEEPKVIYEKITKKTIGIDFIVLELDRWYGDMYDETVEWLKENFPNIEFIK
jgi:hypothetical protein